MRPPREDTVPWYKQFWPWFLISLPASVVVAAIYTVNLAFQTDDGLVSDDYYKEGLAIHKDADRSARAKALGIAGTLSYDADTGAVSFKLNEQPRADSGPLSLQLNHPTLPDQDQTTRLTPVNTQHYVGRIAPLAIADWKLKIQPESGDWRIDGRLERGATSAPLN